MAISLTTLQQQLFKAVDQVIETGIPLEVERNGHRLKIVLEEKKGKLTKLKQHDCIVGDPDELVDMSALKMELTNYCKAIVVTT
ncbi:MAG: hypothetical protein V3U78_07710 [Thiotrichaceae bacterium]